MPGIMAAVHEKDIIFAGDETKTNSCVGDVAPSMRTNLQCVEGLGALRHTNYLDVT